MRRLTIAVLNLVKYVLFIGGISLLILCILALDSEGEAFHYIMKGSMYSVLLLVSSMVAEWAAISFCNDNESIRTLFNFTFYGKKSNNAYISIVHKNNEFLG